MNGYEKHSDDYGGPEPGWGTWVMVAVIGVIVLGSIVLGHFLS